MDNRYIIEKIYVEDGYERTAVIREVEGGDKKTIHFLECDEYLEWGEESKKKKAGYYLKGNIFVGLVIASSKIDGQLMHRQRIDKSSYIEAIVDVAEVRDKFSVYAFSIILQDKILIEFERSINHKKGDRIFIEGSLEFEEFDENLG